MDKLEQRIEKMELQLSGIYDLLKTLVESYNNQEEQTIYGIKALTEAIKSVLEKLEDYTQHTP